MAGELITEDYQYEYNGLLLGCNTDYDATEFTELLGYNTLRSSSESSFGRHGGVSGRHYADIRQFTGIININGQAAGLHDDAAYASLRREIGRAFAPRSHPRDELPFFYRHPGQESRYINCRPIDLDFPVNREFALKYPRIAIRFECTDPRHYSAEQKICTAELPTPGGGLTFPLDFQASGGLNFGGAGEAGSCQVVNEGTAPANWIGIVEGPVTNPRISMVHNEDGETHELVIQGLTVIAGEQLVFDSRDRSIRIGDQSRRRFLTPQSLWMTLPPNGEVVTITYNSDNTPPTSSTFTIIWSDAYWGD